MKNLFKLFGIIAMVAVIGALTGCASMKVVDKNVPVEESAIIYASKGAFIHKCDDTKFGIVTDVLSMNNLKGRGSATFDEIGKPILQIPAGQHTIAGNIDGDSYAHGRLVTHDFLPGHCYQMVYLMNLTEGDIAKELAKVMLGSAVTGVDWCFLDITEEVKAKKKKSSFMETSRRGEIGVGQTVVKVPTITNPGAK
jgi:hypothetical protein